MNTHHLDRTHDAGALCSDENIAFLMLSEVLRARSLDIFDALKDGPTDVTHLRRMALHMSLSAEDLIRSAGLLKRTPERLGRLTGEFAASSAEPASLHSIIDLFMIAAKKRLAEFGLKLHLSPTPRDLFVAGNPWELAYAMFTLVRNAARARAQLQPHMSHYPNLENAHSFNVDIDIAEGFVDICVPATTPLNPYFTDEGFPIEPGNNMNHAEWFCFQRLLELNGAHVSVQISDKNPNQRYRITMRLPTFQPGHEEPSDFLTMP